MYILLILFFSVLLDSTVIFFGHPKRVKFINEGLSTIDSGCISLTTKFIIIESIKFCVTDVEPEPNRLTVNCFLFGGSLDNSLFALLIKFCLLKLFFNFFNEDSCFD